jgi:hypothetical protein
VFLPLDVALKSNCFSDSPWLYLNNIAGLGRASVAFALTNSTTGAFSVLMSTHLADCQ